MTFNVTVIAALLLFCVIALMVGWIVVASAFGGMLRWPRRLLRGGAQLRCQ
ncbi:hypothetical protein SAMN04489832_2421 [Micromonospora cremea]|uniref:Uncharacterized protein n=1 Tax=Micromonospora cremea TaxID=709881 RepID=A0A1N5WHC4_9ACTN|nr:hypothetical protein SAMN04489832_2421 [Micromonospora cremea]